MNIDYLSAKELLGFLYVKTDLTPIEKALIRHLEAALDQLEALKV